MSGPLSLLEVLADEHRALGVRPHLPENVQIIAARLRDGSNAFAVRLRGMLSDVTGELLTTWARDPKPGALHEELVRDLDRLLSEKAVTRASLQRELGGAFIEMVEPLTLADFYRIDTAALAREVSADSKPDAGPLRAQLSQPTHEALSGWSGGAPPPALVDDLDRLVRDDVIARTDLVARYPSAFRSHDDVGVGLANFYGWIHRLRAGKGSPRAALCLSGGGIRSATFGLGVLQGLADGKLLDRFDYLSTVSGGGYIGGWLSAWIHRHPQGRQGVMRDLVRATENPLSPEVEPIRRLRAYSNYLTPRAGLFSIDTWTGIASYLRNLILNWLVLLPILAVLLAVPRLAVSVVRWDPVGALSGLGVTPWVVAAVPAGLAVLLVLVTIRYMASERPSLGQAGDAGGDAATIAATYRRRFRYQCLYPLALSAAILALIWSRLNDTGCGAATLEGLARGLCGALSPSVMLMLLFAVGGALVHFLVYALYVSRLRRDRLPEGWRVVLSGAVGGVLSWVATAKISSGWTTRDHLEAYVVLGLPTVLAIVLLTATFFVGLMSRLMDDEDREWSARFGGYVAALLAAWIVLSGLALFGPHLFYVETPWYRSLLAAVGGVSGAVTLLKGWSSSTSGHAGATRPSGLGAVVMRNALTLVAGIFAAAVAIVLAWATSALMVRILSIADDLAHPTHHDVLVRASIAQNVGTMLVLIVFGCGMAHFINANKFSLHGMYRSRLIRAYLGASRMVRTPNPFTGFDPNDNVAMSRLRTELRAEIGDVDVARFVTVVVPAAPTPPPPAAKPGTTTKVLNVLGSPVRLVKRCLASRPKAPRPRDQVPARLFALLRAETRVMLQDPAQRKSPRLWAALLDDLNVAMYSTRELFPRDVVRELLPPEGAEEYVRKDLDIEARTRIHRDLLTACDCGIAARRSVDQRPLHVVDIALNLVGGRELAWQERKAASFTVSPLHAGSWGLGYRRAEEYGQGPVGGSISLGTAVAISGAAASPNQGYHSSPLVTFLMALFNVRLGWWLGNPGRFGEATYKDAFPTDSASPVLRETLGLTDDESPFVYLSDGGHFENLGLYEMVLRRCHVIVVSDAGCDPACSLDDLGNAIRKIRVDFGIPITFDEGFNVRGRPSPTAGAAAPVPPPLVRYCAVGTIDYRPIDGPEAVPGTLVYLKPAFYGLEPRDVFNYATAHPTFPHESTLNQWFTESQFESYRALGRHVMREVSGGSVTGLDAFCSRAKTYAVQAPPMPITPGLVAP